MSDNIYTEVIGWIGGIIIILINMPQLYKLYITKSGDDLSYYTIILDILGSSFLGTYGILINKLPIIISNIIIIILAILILFLKIKYSNTSKLESSLSNLSKGSTFKVSKI